MRIKLAALSVIALAALACGALSTAPPEDSPGKPAATVTPPPTLVPTETPVPEPSFIPEACAGRPIATIPPATAAAGPTPALTGNPSLDTDQQVAVFDELAGIIEDVYLYPDFNGRDWQAITEEYRAGVLGGLDSEAFYARMEQYVAELGDEHSYFESPAEAAAADAELAGVVDYVGVGVYVMPLLEKGRVTILGVLANSASEHAGLQPHDSILAVDGLPLVEDGISYPNRLRGPECSSAVLTVQSPGGAPRQVALIRYRITSPLPLNAQLLPTRDGSRIGYLFLPTFSDGTVPDRVRQALVGFGPLDGLILDNRMNGGGSSSVLEPVLGLFTAGTLGSYISRGAARPLSISPSPVGDSQSVPLVVLVGEDTVSYGEVFAGLLQNTGRARVVGQTTLGNVETLHGYTLRDGSRAWIAQERFQPEGSAADWERDGIVPDVEAYADWDTFTLQDDPGVAAALALLGHGS